ncbi:MAG: cellulase family glycosylhydrolase [Chloroflexi bacterium]|nr:cellulase family glycosylhydrolase [Chloroflexota bacterium]
MTIRPRLTQAGPRRITRRQFTRLTSTAILGGLLAPIAPAASPAAASPATANPAAASPAATPLLSTTARGVLAPDPSASGRAAPAKPTPAPGIPTPTPASPKPSPAAPVQTAPVQATPVPASSAPAASVPVSLVSARGEMLVDEAGRPFFLLGASYQGPADRAWKMWADDQFDATLIAMDFGRARAAGLNALRIFVQYPLAQDAMAGRWNKLDQVLDLADRNHLRLIVTLADYTDWDLARLATVDDAIAARYRGRPTILAYDLKNEPRFGDLALSIYPPESTASLQDAGLVPRIGERMTQAELPEYRASDDGKKVIPERLTDDRAYVYLNVLRAYLQFLDDSAAWAKKHDATSVRYVGSPEGAAWAPLVDALNDSLAAWMRPRLGAIRRADPDRLVTLAHVDTFLATQPVNDWLDYRTYHRYPTATPAGIRAALALWDDVRSAVPGRPLVLGEFGFSNDATDEAMTATLEANLVQGIRDRGAAGAIKWMLNDFPNGANPRENSFGMYRGDGSPKPVVATFRAIAELPPRVTTAPPASPRAAVATCAASIAGVGPAGQAAQAQSLGMVAIAGTSGQGAYLRRTPRRDDRLSAWPDGTRLDLLGPETIGDGVHWLPVRDACGLAAWIPASYAAPTAP